MPTPAGETDTATSPVGEAPPGPLGLLARVGCGGEEREARALCLLGPGAGSSWRGSGVSQQLVRSLLHRKEPLRTGGGGVREMVRAKMLKTILGD